MDGVAKYLSLNKVFKCVSLNVALSFRGSRVHWSTNTFQNMPQTTLNATSLRKQKQDFRFILQIDQRYTLKYHIDIVFSIPLGLESSLVWRDKLSTRGPADPIKLHQIGCGPLVEASRLPDVCLGPLSCWKVNLSPARFHWGYFRTSLHSTLPNLSSLHRWKRCNSSICLVLCLIFHSIIRTAYRGALELISADIGPGRGLPWTGCQFIAGLT